MSKFSHKRKNFWIWFWIGIVTSIIFIGLFILSILFIWMNYDIWVITNLNYEKKIETNDYKKE